MRWPSFTLKRLSTQIYLTVIVALVALVVLSSLFWRRAFEGPPVRQALQIAGELVAAGLPPATAPEPEQAAAAERLAARLGVDVALHAADGHRITGYGRALPPPPSGDDDGGFIIGRHGPAWAVPLPDGRWLIARLRHTGPPRPALRLLMFLGGLALVIGLVAWPVVRGLTRRLDQLNDGVERLGAGDLTARVEIKGRDEIARLADSLNRSAARIEELVAAHRMLLANASHELRTPLARIRMGLELIGQGTPDDRARRAALHADVAELDVLIEELLLLSRLDALDRLDVVEPVDLLALAAEEASRTPGVDVAGATVTVDGDPRLLRHLVRNIIDNAAKHGAPPIIVATARLGGMVTLSCTDAGAGVNKAQAERMFEPFARGASRGRIEGSGLGLALVRRIARRHGGDARFAPGNGERLNRLVVELPAA
ncbi:MAG: ATP-binding protein [Hyphomicrobiaceae bacterium]|nr:ATP-binding protein [Hyphomicrobiaceae bacterium]